MSSDQMYIGDKIHSMPVKGEELWSQGIPKQWHNHKVVAHTHLVKENSIELVSTFISTSLLCKHKAKECGHSTPVTEIIEKVSESFMVQDVSSH